MRIISLSWRLSCNVLWCDTHQCTRHNQRQLRHVSLDVISIILNIEIKHIHSIKTYRPTMQCSVKTYQMFNLSALVPLSNAQPKLLLMSRLINDRLVDSWDVAWTRWHLTEAVDTEAHVYITLKIPRVRSEILWSHRQVQRYGEVWCLVTTGMVHWHAVQCSLSRTVCVSWQPAWCTLYSVVCEELSVSRDNRHGALARCTV